MGARIAYRIACSDWYQSKESLFEWPLQWWHITTPFELKMEGERELQRLVRMKDMDHKIIISYTQGFVPGNVIDKRKITYWTARYRQHDVMERELQDAFIKEDWAMLHELLTRSRGPMIANEY